MKTYLARLLVMSVGMNLACAVFAQSNIAELIEQTGIEAGDVAMRDMPGWREPKKIVVRDIALSQGEIPDKNFMAR